MLILTITPDTVNWFFSDLQGYLTETCIRADKVVIYFIYFQDGISFFCENKSGYYLHLYLDNNIHSCSHKIVYLADFTCNAETKTINCISQDNKQTTCSLGGGGIILGVNLQNIYSRDACIHMQTPPPPGYRIGDLGVYGWESNTVWVSRGCKAQFKVCFKGNTVIVGSYIPSTFAFLTVQFSERYFFKVA